jgi:hypothetical protein
MANQVKPCGHERRWSVLSPAEIPDYESDGEHSYCIGHFPDRERFAQSLDSDFLTP